MLYKLLLIFCLYLPFQVALNPARGIDLASSRIFIIILFFLWLAERLKERKLIVGKYLAELLFLSFLFLSFFSVVTAQNMEWSFRKIAFWLSIAPIYFIVSALVDNRWKMEKVITFLIISGVALAILGIIQFLAQFIFGIEAVYAFWAKTIIAPFLGESFSEAVLKNPSWLVNVSGVTLLRSNATFPDPHMLSFYLGMLTPLALGMFLDKRRKIFLLSFGILTIGNLLTFSRGGYLGLFFTGLFFLFFFWKRIAKKYKLFLFSFIFVFSLIALIPNPIATRFISSFNLSEGSNVGRMETWKQALEIIRSNSLIGVGIGNYALEIKPTADYREPIYAHSAYLDIAAETGLINLFIWLSFLGVLFFAYLKKAEDSLIFLGLAGSILIFSVHSVVETAIYSPTVLSLFLIIAGFGAACGRDRKNLK